MIEPLLCNQFLEAVLGGDATISGVVGTKLYSNQPPPRTSRPFVVWNLQGGADTQGVGVVRIMAKPLYHVRLVFDGPPQAAIIAAAHQIDALLQATVNYAVSGYVISVRREQPMNLPANLPDALTRIDSLGGLYRFYVAKSGG